MPSKEPSNDSSGDEAAEQIEENQLDVSLDSIGSKRGRPLIQDQWTRIVEVNAQLDPNVKVYVIATELLLEDSMLQVPRQTRQSKPWSFYFSPKQYWEDHPNMTFENTKLSNNKLMQYGKQLTKLREKQRQLALAQNQHDEQQASTNVEYVTQLSARM